MVQAVKTPYGKYPEYHNSLDNKEFMSIDSVEHSTQLLIAFIHLFELVGLKLKNTLAGGEPHLSKHQLYPTYNGPMSNKMSSDVTKDARYQLNLLLQIVSLVDGSRDILDIAEKLKKPLLDIYPIIHQLIKHQLISIDQEGAKQ